MARTHNFPKTRTARAIRITFQTLNLELRYESRTLYRSGMHFIRAKKVKLVITLASDTGEQDPCRFRNTRISPFRGPFIVKKNQKEKNLKRILGPTPKRFALTRSEEVTTRTDMCALCMCNV